MQEDIKSKLFVKFIFIINKIESSETKLKN